MNTPIQAQVDHGEYGALKAMKEWTPPADPGVLKKLEHWQDEKVGVLLH